MVRGEDVQSKNMKKISHNSFANPQLPPTKGKKEFEKEKRGENSVSERANLTALFLSKIFLLQRGLNSAKRGVLNCSAFDS